MPYKTVVYAQKQSSIKEMNSRGIFAACLAQHLASFRLALEVWLMEGKTGWRLKARFRIIKKMAVGEALEIFFFQTFSRLRIFQMKVTWIASCAQIPFGQQVAVLMAHIPSLSLSWETTILKEEKLRQGLCQ